jgi:hypothetical protein
MSTKQEMAIISKFLREGWSVALDRAAVDRSGPAGTEGPPVYIVRAAKVEGSVFRSAGGRDADLCKALEAAAVDARRKPGDER